MTLVFNKSTFLVSTFYFGVWQCTQLGHGCQCMWTDENYKLLKSGYGEEKKGSAGWTVTNEDVLRKVNEDK